MFNSEDFEVSSSGRVSISRAITDIGVAITGSILPEPPLYPTGRIPAVNGVRGFNISTNQDLLGQGRPTRTILSAFANADPRSINSYDSAHEIFVNGDFTVFGDAYGRSSNRSAHGSASFAVDPVLNKVTILGGYTAGYVNGSYTVTNERATPAPTLEFVDNRGGCRGRITGLTAPSSGCDAANKDYVDQRISNIYMFGSPPAEMTTQFYAGTDADVIKTITLNPGTYNIKMEGHVQYFPQQGGGSARSCVVKHLQWVAAEGGLLSGQGELKLRFMNENLGGAGYGYLPGSSSVDMTEIQVLPRLANDPLQGQGYPVVFTLYALRGEASNGVPAGIAGGTGNRRFRSNGCSVTISRIS
jgi:hypothetical protein